MDIIEAQAAIVKAQVEAKKTWKGYIDSLNEED